jgi:glycine/D-amino acid oxidase-like deaminating enzyme
VTFDLAIVGAGVIGATAFFLARQQNPEWQILLLDRSLIAKGASAFSAGLDLPYGRTPWQKQLSLTSQRMYVALKTRVPDLPIRCLPFVGIVKQGNLNQVLERFTSETVHVAGIAEREIILTKLPGFRIAEDQEMLAGSFGAIGLVDQIVSLLVANVCRSPGGHCWEGVAVTQIRPVPEGGHELDVMDGRRISARHVLIATGPWLLGGPGRDLAKKAGVRIKKIAALHVLRSPAPECPILYFFDEDAFLLPVTERGQWIFSFTSREWDCAPDSGMLHITPAERNAALSILDGYYPDLLPFCSGGRVFCDAYSPDWAPIVSSDPEANNLVIAGACSGSGFRLAPAIALNALQLFNDFASSGDA